LSNYYLTSAGPLPAPDQHSSLQTHCVTTPADLSISNDLHDDDHSEIDGRFDGPDDEISEEFDRWQNILNANGQDSAL
jgi:hypothetical protein